VTPATSEASNDPPAVEIVNLDGTSPVVLVCEHASRYLPARYRGLGLSEPDLSRHIAWDIGAARLARALAARIDAPLFLHGYSRLLIDPNRPLTAPDSIPTVSENTVIPGNLELSAEERRDRAARYFTPFHDAIAHYLDARRAAKRPTFVVGVHSFTPVFRGVSRPWHVGVLYAAARQFGQSLVETLGEELELVVGTNEPYRISADGDYTVPIHGDGRGLPSVLFEVRQDLLGTPAEIEAWADRLARALQVAIHDAEETTADGRR
jgi:predicted N-formylglutamate amidohydrolase